MGSSRARAQLARVTQPRRRPRRRRPKAPREPYDLVQLVADTSAWIEIRKSTTSKQAKWRFDTALRRDQLFSSPIVRLELYRGARSRAEVDEVDERLRVGVVLPLAPAIATLGVGTVRELATEGASGFHQLPVCDVLIAATAAAHGLGVLTCDWHGASFDVCTGRVLGLPATSPLRTYDTRVEDGRVFVTLPD